MEITRRSALFALAAALAPAFVGAPALPACGQESLEAARAGMVEQIRQHGERNRADTGRGPPAQRVLDAMAKVPRHEFVPERFRRYAYLDTPLPLGHGQSISQPYIVALMTDLARIKRTDVVFETGTGAGYHAAVLAELAQRVVSVEVIGPLALKASATLKRLGYKNVEVVAGDGYYGLAARGPYDAMIIKEAVGHIPQPLLKQLKPGGRMVIPLGPRDGPQHLTLVEKGLDGRISEKRILPVRFTPMQGGERI